MLFHRNGKFYTKIHIEFQGTPNSQNDLEKEQSWMTQLLISKLTANNRMES
jgi:hypothetical protein